MSAVITGSLRQTKLHRMSALVLVLFIACALVPREATAQGAQPEVELKLRSLGSAFPVLLPTDVDVFVCKLDGEARTKALDACSQYWNALRTVDGRLAEELAKLTPRMDQLHAEMDLGELNRNASKRSDEELRAEANRRYEAYQKAMLAEGLLQKSALVEAKALQEAAGLTSQLLDALSGVAQDKNGGSLERPRLDAALYLLKASQASELPSDFSSLVNLREVLAQWCKTALTACVPCTELGAHGGSGPLDDLVKDWELTVGAYAKSVLEQCQDLPNQVKDREHLQGVPLDGSTEMEAFARRGREARKRLVGVSVSFGTQCAALLTDKCGEATGEDWLDVVQGRIAPRLCTSPWSTDEVQAYVLSVPDLGATEREAILRALDQVSVHDLRPLRRQLFNLAMDQYVDTGGTPPTDSRASARLNSIQGLQNKLRAKYDEASSLVQAQLPEGARPAVRKLLGSGSGNGNAKR